jgi:putative thioredoxin
MGYQADMASSPYIFDVTADDFATIVLEGSRTRPVLVDFWAAWCNPCRALTPVLEKLVDEFRGDLILAKVDTEDQRELAAHFGIRSLPTVRLFKDGQPVDEFMGALPEQDIRAFLDKHIPRASDNLVTDAQRLIREGQVDEAMKLVEAARTSDPDNSRVQIAYAQIKATLGEVDEAEVTLAALPLDEQDKPEVLQLRARVLFDRVTLSAPAPEALEKALTADPGNSEARYQLAAHKVMDGDYEAALDLLITLMQKDRKYGDDAARKGMLKVFDILGGSGELVSRYRARMFNALH